MNTIRCLLFLFIFSFSILCTAKTNVTNLEIKTIKPFQKWRPDQIQETQIAIQLPKNFHAYKDQLKVINTKPAGFKSGQISLSPEVEFYDKRICNNARHAYT